MWFQEVARQLEMIERGFADSTRSLAQIFRDLKLTSDVAITTGAPTTVKYAASAAIVSEIEELMREASNPDSIAVAIQLSKVGDKVRLALPGGAVLYSQEMVWIQNPAG